MKYTFRGGVHLDEHKYTEAFESEEISPPARVYIPMSQHIGAPCNPLVKKGDRVLLGQKIGDVTGGLGCPVHSSVSGTVISLDEKSTPSGQRIVNVVIENDMKNELSPEIRPFGKKLTEADFEEIVGIVREAGISGMGGATFPTYAKLNSARGKVSRMIVNCAECEPFITANHRLLLEDPAAVINGTKILLRALGVKHADIAVEDNKLDAVNVLEELLADSRIISVSVMKTKYPQGDERQLIYALYGTELRQGQLPADAGCVIFNAETCASVFYAFRDGMPACQAACHGLRRLHPGAEKPDRADRNARVRAYRVLRRTCENSEEDNLRRTDDGTGSVGQGRPRYEGNLRDTCALRGF